MKKIKLLLHEKTFWIGLIVTLLILGAVTYTFACYKPVECEEQCDITPIPSITPEVSPEPSISPEITPEETATPSPTETPHVDVSDGQVDQFSCVHKDCNTFPSQPTSPYDGQPVGWK